MIDFEDLNPYNGSHTPFAVCNENISIWRKVLEGISVESAASICSGGEVSFFAILPVVKKKLVLIDHSYRSMYFALGKYHLIEKMGAKEAYKLLVESRQGGDLQTIFDEANNTLPTKRDELSYSNWFNGWYGAKGIYEDITEEGITKFRNNRNKVSFLHGDLNDLADKGPFDFVYLSNALDYAGRNGSKYDIEKMVKPGGYVAYCCGTYSSPKITKYEVVASADAHSIRNTYEISWNYKLCKVPE